jgi:hypothetical protein
METHKNESDIAPLIQEEHPKETTIKKIDFCNFLECGACALIIFFSCFKP